MGATGSVNALPREVLLSQIDQADFLILTHHRDPVKTTATLPSRQSKPFVRPWRTLREPG